MEVVDSHRRARDTVLRSLAGFGLAAGVLAGTATGAVADEAEPVPSPTGPSPVPAPTTVEPPPDSPFDDVVGGAGLARIGEPLVGDSAPPLPAVDGYAWLVADIDSGDVLAAFSPHETRPPASTIKLLTAITARPRLEPTDEYLADAGPEAVEGSRAGIVADGTYTVEDLLHGLILPSGNDAAYALGELLGGQDTALALMNEQARALGAFDTTAATPHGLDTPGQVSSAYDLALIGRAALADDAIAAIARTPDYDFPGQDGETYQIQNQNRLLDSYPGAVGLKTGYTTQADHTFVGAVERDDRRLVATVLAADGRAEDAAATLFDWAYQALESGDPEPVGHLVTPEEVEAAMADVADEEPADDPGGAAGGGADGNAADIIDAVSGESSRPVMIWAAVATVAVGMFLTLMLRRRRRPAGRYASGRR